MKAIVKVIAKTELELDKYYTTYELKEYVEDNYEDLIYPINMLTNFRVIEYGVEACTD
jgi:hypothetical protein